MPDKKSFLDAVSLVYERDQWRQEFRNGTRPRPWTLGTYEHNRNDELWRASRLLEDLCEYTLYLEEMLRIASNKDG